ncbi:MAG TPA: TIGR03086 family metal-binding protein [Acidimicrobiales bacterium]
MDLLDLDRQALASTRAFVAGTDAGQLGLPTPCEGWDVRALLNHILGNNHVYAAAIGGPVDWARRDDDRIGDDHRAAYDRSVEVVTAAFTGADQAAEAEMPFGRIPVPYAIAVHFVDILTHGWDLAVATGQDPVLDADLAEAAILVVGGYPPEVWGTPQFFAEQVPAPDDAPAHVRLVSLLGRRP